MLNLDLGAAEDVLGLLLFTRIPTHFQKGSQVPHTENKARSGQRR